MVKKRKAIPVTASIGNVFADIGLPEAEEELTKAQLASEIRQIIKRARLTQVAAAALMRIDQPKVSALLNGRLTNFSGDRLMRLLADLTGSFCTKRFDRNKLGKELCDAKEEVQP